MALQNFFWYTIKTDMEKMEKVEILKQAIQKELSKSADAVSIIRFIELLIEYAYRSRASDVHLEPEEKDVKVRLRIDGVLQDVFTFSKELQSEVVARVKVLSELKTDIHHIPQDGRFRAKIRDLGEVDVRVSIVPTYYNENVVLRILAEIIPLSFEDMGFTSEQTLLINKAISKPYGMILANGPTGSGKTTTLYTLIKQLNTKDVSIITIEDPIEYSIKGITQIPLNVQSGLTFATGLRSILRQDPNIIMVGEIRDFETANIAINAALTGHLMLSTLHTNDAPGSMTRLNNMGIEPFLTTSTIVMVIAQRLVRLICPRCKEQFEVEYDKVKHLGITPEMVGGKSKVMLSRGTGCDLCSNTGYKGRSACYEVMEINDKIRDLVLERAPTHLLKQMARENGMKTLREAAVWKLLKGVTTLEEVMRVTFTDTD